MSSIARFDTWQAADGTNVARYNAGVLEVWDGAAWVEPGAGSGVAATGGTVSTITIAGVECNLHTFTSSGTFTVTSAGTVDYLMVAGGGGGGLRTGSNGGAGGGGSGGVLSGSVAVTPGDYTITIGAGGAGRSGSDGVGTQGQNTVAFGLTCVGGGYGNGNAGAGGNGGSGGGSGSNSTAGAGGASGSGTAGQGFDGGATTNSNQAGHGGGPMGEGGSIQPNEDTPGAGIDGSPFLGEAAYTTIVGGGGTGRDSGGALTSVQTAGGKSNGQDGVRGGGGAGFFNGAGPAGDGGDGVVYIRYAV